MADLLNCPFCGGAADVSHDHTVEENHAYGCRKCSVWFDTFNSDDAIAAWNRRAPAAAARAEGRREGLLEAAGIADGYHQRALEWAKNIRGLEQHVGKTDSLRIADELRAAAEVSP